MLLGQADQKYYANQRCGPAFQYKVYNMGWLNTKKLITKKSSHKLKNIYNRKYAVKKIINSYAIRLEFPLEL